MEKNGVATIDESIHTKLEYIRENYNKILLNIQKMITSSQPLMSHRDKYERNKNALMEVIGNKSNSLNKQTFKRDVPSTTVTLEHKPTVGDHIDTAGREWLEKINNDIDTIQKEQNKHKRVSSAKESCNTKSTYTGNDLLI
jgi:hypothetical protein